MVTATWSVRAPRWRRTPGTDARDGWQVSVLLVGLAASVGGLLVLGFVAGLRLDPNREVRIETTLDASVEQVYELLARIDRYALWREDVERIEWVGERQPPTWVEFRNSGRLTLELVSDTRPSHREHRVAMGSDPFDGTWRFELSPGAGPAQTVLVITERGRIRNPLFRCFWRLFVERSAYLDPWVASLQAEVDRSRQTSSASA